MTIIYSISTCIEKPSFEEIECERRGNIFLSHALIKGHIDLPTEPVLRIGIGVYCARDQAFFYRLSIDVTHPTRQFLHCSVDQVLSEPECIFRLVLYFEGKKRFPETVFEED